MDALLPSLISLSIETKRDKGGPSDENATKETSRVRTRRDGSKAENQRRQLNIEESDDLAFYDTPSFANYLFGNFNDTDEEETDPEDLAYLRTTLRNAKAKYESTLEHTSFEEMYAALVAFTSRELEVIVEQAVREMVDEAVIISGQFFGQDKEINQNAMSDPPIKNFKLILWQRKSNSYGFVQIEAYAIGKPIALEVKSETADAVKSKVVQFLLGSGAVATPEQLSDGSVKVAFLVRQLKDSKR